LQFFIKKIYKFFSTVNFFKFLLIKTLDSELDPDSQLGKLQDPDPHESGLCRRTSCHRFFLKLLYLLMFSCLNLIVFSVIVEPAKKDKKRKSCPAAAFASQIPAESNAPPAQKRRSLAPSASSTRLADVAKGQPKAAKARPEAAKARPEVAKARPEVAKARLEVAKARPEAATAEPAKTWIPDPDLSYTCLLCPGMYGIP
jgi:hypothetical protein